MNQLSLERHPDSPAASSAPITIGRRSKFAASLTSTFSTPASAAHIPGKTPSPHLADPTTGSSRDERSVSDPIPMRRRAGTTPTNRLTGNYEETDSDSKVEERVSSADGFEALFPWEFSLSEDPEGDEAGTPSLEDGYNNSTDPQVNPHETWRTGTKKVGLREADLPDQTRPYQNRFTELDLEASDDDY